MRVRRRIDHAAAVALMLLAAGCSTHAVAIDASVAVTSTTSTTSTISTTSTTSTTTSTSTTTPTTTTTTTTTIPPTTVAPTTVPPPPPTAKPKPPTATLPAPKPPAAERAQEDYTELGTIEIPALGVTKKLLEGVSLNTLDIAPGHWPGTAMPGHQGNVVIAGHRVSHDRPFRNIDQLQPGDEVVLTTAEGRYVYNVVSTEIVAPDAVWIINQTADYTATLFACHPPGSTRQRIVVHLALST